MSVVNRSVKNYVDVSLSSNISTFSVYMFQEVEAMLGLGDDTIISVVQKTLH